MNKKVSILFPVEIISRELDYKLFLGCMLASDSNKVFIGQHDAIFRLTRYLQGGVYVGKNAFLEEWPLATLERYQNIKRNGFIFVHLDEEGAVYNGLEPQWEKWLSRRLDPRCLAKEDYICTWGDFQRDYYRSFSPACFENITTTGYPKFDLYKDPYCSYYYKEKEKINKEFGDFILLCVNFSYVNYKLGTKGAFAKRTGYDVQDPVKQTSFLNWWVHDTKVYADFIRLVNVLRIKFPDRNIILRPHPCEELQTYMNIFSGVKNVHVIHEGSVAPWLLGSKVLIHNGCTTAIEAHFLNKKIINYVPLQDEEQKLFLPSKVGVFCTTEQAVLAQAEILLSGKGCSRQEDLNSKAKKLLSNFDSSHGLDKLLDIIEKAERRVSDQSLKYKQVDYGVNEFLLGAYRGFKNVARPLFPEKERLHRFLTSSQMFSGISPKDIKAKVRSISGILKKDIIVKFHTSEVFLLEERK